MVMPTFAQICTTITHVNACGPPRNSDSMPNQPNIVAIGPSRGSRNSFHIRPCTATPRITGHEEQRAEDRPSRQSLVEQHREDQAENELDRGDDEAERQGAPQGGEVVARRHAAEQELVGSCRVRPSGSGRRECRWRR